MASGQKIIATPKSFEIGENNLKINEFLPKFQYFAEKQLKRMIILYAKSKEIEFIVKFWEESRQVSQNISEKIRQNR